MRKVTIVVPVLITSCQVSLKPKSGPLTAHTVTVASASAKAAGLPVTWEIHFANVVNQ
jgi:hypothetical protein